MLLLFSSTTKADFIRSKHQSLSFVFRPSKEEISSDDADLSQQLHSSVRTNNLETSLRLLSQGADANFFHPVRITSHNYYVTFVIFQVPCF